MNESENILNSILNSSLYISIISTDLHHRITFWNKGAEMIFGYTAEEILGHDIDELYSRDPETKEKIEIFRRDITNRKTRTLEVQQVHKNGSNLWINLTVTPRMDENNELIGALGIGEDITERKISEKANLSLLEQLRQSQKMEALGKLAGGVAHDFNNFLTVIRGYTELLIKELPQEDEKHKDLNEIMTASKNATILIRQLLAFSRKQIVNPQIFDLNEVIILTGKMMHQILSEDVELILDLAKDLPKVKLDQGQMTQVLMNLVINANDALPEGGTITINTKYVSGKSEMGSSNDFRLPTADSRLTDFIEINVSDTGTGMSEEVKQHIFEPFYTTKSSDKGTGLGLSVVYGNIKQNNGWINVDSKPGQGTIFKIYLPCM